MHREQGFDAGGYFPSIGRKILHSDHESANLHADVVKLLQGNSCCVSGIRCYCQRSVGSSLQTRSWKIKGLLLLNNVALFLLKF